MSIMESSVGRTGVSVVLTLATIILAGTAVAGVPENISYQGRLTDTIGNPIDTIVDLTFTIFADEAGTSDLWTETHPDVVIENGLFAVTLGKFTSFGPSLFNGQTRYLGIQLSGGVMSSPLIAMVSTPYSLRSTYSDTASYAHAGPGSGATGWTDDGSTIRLTSLGDSVGIGTTDPRAPLEVQGEGHAIIGESHGSGTSAGVLGTNNSNGFGLMGVSTNGRGVTGLSTSGFGGHFYGPKNYFSANLGIGTETPDEMLHIYRNNSGGTSFLKIQSDHASNWGETGLRLETPQNMWHLRMDDAGNAQVPFGGLGLRSQNLNAEVMTWTNDGKVGIGLTEPTYKLQVSSTSNALRIYAGSGFASYFVGPKDYFSGSVGIGTENPTHKLTVNGSVAIQSGGDTKFHINYYNGGLNFSETTVGDYRLNIEEGGNVGIGTGSPTAKLHVNGDTRIAGTLTADGFADNTINRYDIIDEVGIANVSASSAFGPGGWEPVLTKQLTVPTAGYILALGCVQIHLDHGISFISYTDVAISDQTNSNGGSNIYSFRLDDNVSAGDYHVAIPCHRLFYVSAGGTYTYYMLVAGWHASVEERNMSLLFLPTPYGSENLADGSDAEYATADRIMRRQEGGDLVDRLPPESTEIDRLREELATLRKSVEELQSRVAEGGQ